MLVERFDEGLVCAWRLLGLPEYSLPSPPGAKRRNPGYQRPDPTPEERAALRDINRVNHELYAHFMVVFEHKWAALGADGLRLLARLRNQTQPSTERPALIVSTSTSRPTALSNQTGASRSPDKTWVR